MKLQRAASIAATLIAVNSVGGAALGHPEDAPVTIDRAIRIDLQGDALRVTYTVLYGTWPAGRARREADRNRDGRLEPDEVRALGARIAARVRKGLSLVIDGKRVAPAFDPPVVGLAGDRVAPSPFSIDLVARIPLRGAEHTLRLDDHTALPSPGDTDVRVEPDPGVALLEAHRGPPDGRGERRVRFLFRGPRRSLLEDRSITVRFRPATAAAR